MHSKDTVRYICEDFVVSGKKLFWKQELLTTNSYSKPESIYWSRRKPIRGATFTKAQQAGYCCEIVTVTRSPGAILSFSLKPLNHTKRRKRTAGLKGVKSAITRFLSR